MGRRLSLLALLFALAPAPSLAADEASADDRHAFDEERPESEADQAGPAAPTEVPKDATSPAPAVDERPAAAAPAAAPAGEGRPATGRSDFVPATQSLTLEPGGAGALLAGYAFPRFVLDGSMPDSVTTWGTANAAARLFWDFPAMELDWRVSMLTIFTDYYALRGTVGVRKELQPFAAPKIVSRGGAGVELMLARDDKATFLVPVFVIEGEVAVEYELVPNLFAIGAGLELTVHYGLPAGIGLNLAGYLPRLKLLF